MKLKGSAVVLFLLVYSVMHVRADIAPPPGFTRVSVSIILESKEDLSDYRFFLVSSNLVKEITVSNGKKTSVGSLGGGARYSLGSIVAIPRKDLVAFGEKPEGEQLKSLEYAVAENKFAGSIKLLTHSFSREIREAEARNVPDAAYRIEKTAVGLIAVPVPSSNSRTNGGGVSFGVTNIERSLTPLGWTTIAGGILMMLALLTLGLWMFMRSIKKSA